MRITSIKGMGPELKAALELRAEALLAGFDAAVRPADVAALGATRHQLSVTGLSASEASHLRSLVRDAIAGLDPQVIHNTDTRSAVRMLDRGGRIPNAYDMFESPKAQQPHLYHGVESAVLGRGHLELSRGMFGTGTNVYGTLHLSDVQHAPMKSHLGELYLREPEWATGSQQFGDVSVVLGGHVLERASFLPADTGIARASELRAVEELPDLLTTRISRNYLADRGSIPGFGTTDTPWSDFRTGTEVQRRLDEVLSLPRERGVAAVREHLTSSAMSDYYVESQVRWATVDDISQLHVRRYRIPSSGISPEQQPAVESYQQLQQQLIDTARERGITVHVSDEPVREARRAAERASWWAPASG